ncbi:LexA family transcriptional regulator [Vibrio rhizosphaerae]|uniref:LexA family transcriptional regulator n=1 Tax=Vibrio rhizosphaerae TaxID=398736 RepID=UPI00146FC00A|nr:XRE family transcriptional regulator [Vibrio rhizosphaerae]
MSLIFKEQEKANNFPERLKKLMDNCSFNDFAKKTGLTRATLNNYANNLTSPTLEKLAIIADAMGTTVEWLASGELPDENMVTVYQYDLRVSAGNGALVEHENPVAEFRFSADWLRQQGLHGKKLSIVPVMGDSMEPSLYDGDLILVRHEEVRDGLCVIRIDNDVLVKRVQYDYAEGKYLISSDNERYKDIELSKDFKGDFQIIGQVVRVLQRVRQAA